MGDPSERAARYEDLLALPDEVTGEILGGELHVAPRPAFPHTHAATQLGAMLEPFFPRGSGPRGWLILNEPECHLGGDVLVPDLAGWRLERFVQPKTPYHTQAPDWACEVLSPGYARKDRTKKIPIYAREGVTHAWLVDPIEATLEVYELDGPTYRLIQSFAGAKKVRARPFDAIEIDLDALWNI